MRPTHRRTLIQRVIFSAAAVLTAFSAQATSIDEVINNMSPQAVSEAQVIDPRYEWQQHPMVITPAPRGDAIPKWWKGNRPEWTNTIISWFQVFEAQGNGATNTRVEVKNIRVLTLSEATKTWAQVDALGAPDVDLWQYPFSYSSTKSGKRSEATGGISLKPAYPYFHHGYGKTRSIAAPDLRAVYVSMQFRLVVEDPSKPDDRANAKYLVNVGADYHPGKGQSDWSLGYAPGVGQGRLMLANNEWRTATMLVPNTRNGSSLEEMRTNPPPVQ
jgi:hypothetical protein